MNLIIKKNCNKIRIRLPITYDDGYPNNQILFILKRKDFLFHTLLAPPKLF